MKGRIGESTAYGVVLPHARRVAKIEQLSKEGRRRLKWIDYYHEKQNVTDTCRHFDIGRSLFYKWFNRYKKLGLSGLEEESRRPHTVRKREVLPEVQDRIKEIRCENRAWSKYKVAEILRRDEGFIVSSSTVNRVFHDKKLFWPSPITPHQSGARKAWKIKRIRAPKHLRGACPGSLVEIDVKVLNYFGRVFYQFTAIDTCTKIKFIHVYSRKTAHCGQLFIEAMLNFYPFRVRHINSDNGGEFLAECHMYLESRKVTHFFSRARTPKDNPVVENTIKSDEYEFWAWGNLADTTVELNEKARYWMWKFNNYRPHQALNYLTPMEYFKTNFSK
ncbi:MAG: Integrase core domain protein [bacterium ADurb.Bin400]|nr:MAG: Integrase core domain protein [bacterium ADurb.Bin400]